MTECENFKKITVFAIAAIGILAFLMVAGNVVSADPEHLVELPDFPVNAVFAHWGTESYWDTTISGIGGPEEGYYVWDDTWVGWCVDEYDYIYPGTNYEINLSSTYDTDMPWPDPDWDMVNYLINHKNSSASIQDIQDAIWYFVNGGNDPVTIYGQSMKNDALTNGEGFIPNKGQLVAVLVDAGSGVQKTFIEVSIPCSICFVQPLNGVDGDVSGWSTDESMVVLPSSHWDLLGGTADVNGYINSPGILTHRGTRGLGIHGHENDEIDSYDRPERINVTFDSPHILNMIEVRSLFSNEGPGGAYPEEGDVDLYLFGDFIMNYHLVGVENLGAGPGVVNVPIPALLVDKVVFYVNQTMPYASWSEFAVAQLCTGAAVDIEKQVWNVTSSSWEDEIRTPVGTDLSFRIIVTNNGGVNLTDLAITDVLSKQLEYRYNANYSEYYVSPDLHQVIWHLALLEKGESIEIQYRAETVQKCYGWNFVNVTTAESAYDEDTVDVKVPAEGQPVMDIGKQVWDETSGQWKDSVTCVLGSRLKFRVFLNSTALTISEDVNIVDYLPPYLKYSNDASHSPEYYSSNLIEWHFDEISPGETQEIIYHAEALQEGRDDSIVYVTTSELYYDEDSLLVKVVDYPDVELLYPRGGETLSETVLVEWAATDAHDPALDIYLYYSADNGVTWNRLSHIFDTNEYNWDTTELPDGSYSLKVESEDSDHLLAVDTSGLFTIENNEAPTYPPVKPARPSGSANGNPGAIETYSSSTTDPDGDQVFYFWDWGDGTNSGWLGPYNSGEICEASHTWDEKGTYEIKVKAKDSSDKESDWSDPLPITMPKNKAINPFLLFLERLMERFPILEQILQPIYDKLIDI